MVIRVLVIAETASPSPMRPSEDEGNQFTSPTILNPTCYTPTKDHHNRFNTLLLLCVISCRGIKRVGASNPLLRIVKYKFGCVILNKTLLCRSLILDFDFVNYIVLSEII